MPPKRKDWFPIWARQFLEGTISVEPLEVRGFYIVLCCLACNPINPGVIQRAPGIPYSHADLASRMFISLNDFERLLAHETTPSVNRLREDEHGLYIVTWFKYNFEDDGQKSSKADKVDPQTKEAREIALTRNMARKHPEQAFDAVVATHGDSPAWLQQEINRRLCKVPANGLKQYNEITSLVVNGYTGKEILDHFIDGVVLPDRGNGHHGGVGT